MTDRENLISLLRRRGYEHMPVDFSMTPIAHQKLKAYMNKNNYNYPCSPITCLPWVPEKAPKRREFWESIYGHGFKEGTWFDRYGVANEPGSEACLHMTKMYHPLENMTTLSELEAYPYPEYCEEPTDEMLSASRDAHKNGKFVMGSMQCTVWETAWYTRGMEVLMMDMMSEPELAEFVLDKVTDNSVKNAISFAKAGADGIFLGDDIGMQSTIMMSLELYREFLKPRLKRVISEAKSINPDLIVFYHSCGYVTPFIEDLIEAGIDVLNPIQPESMSFEEIFLKYGGRLSFCGTIGTQTTMPFGTPADIRREIHSRLDFVGKRGGLLISPTHVLEPEVPAENIVAYIEACREYKPKQE
ncbi:MAG: hypothetical protein GX851_07520 [Clostridiales bacterium]|nr:hypothetical protein [Clostridiales bacterium]